jgi:phosphoglycerate dehydrogenase-like enzyme
MKPSAYLVNTARGGLVDEEALYRTLAAGQLAGAAIDALADELPKDNLLLQLGDKIVCAPHLGAPTHEAVQKMGIMAAENVAQALRGEKPAGLVNPEVYDKAT